MDKFYSRGEIEYFVFNNLYENVESLSWDGDEGCFYIVDSAEYKVLELNTNDKELREKFADCSEKPYCYKLLQGLDSPCPNCGLNKGAVDNASSWYNMDKGVLSFYAAHTVEENGRQIGRITRMQSTKQGFLWPRVQSLASTRELVVRCMDIVSSDHFDSDGKFTELLSIISRYYGAKFGFIIFFGEHPDKYTYNVDADSEIIPNHTDFHPAFLAQAAMLMDAYSVCWLPDAEQIKDSAKDVYEKFQVIGVNNILIFPIFAGKKILGFMTLMGVSQHEQEFNAASIMAGILGNMETDLTNQIKLGKLLTQDPLTGLDNFDGFKKEAQNLLAHRGDREYILTSIDIKDFRNFNDMFGYETGDVVLKEIASQIKTHLGEEGIYCRVNADIYCALLPFVNEDELRDRFARIAKNMRRFCRDNVAGGLKLEICAGTYIVKAGDKHSLNEIFNRAHMARTHASKMPGSELSVYDSSLHDKTRFAKEIEIHVDDAIRNNYIVPFFQPQMNLSKRAKKHGKVRAEALARWLNEEGYLYARPDEFIPVIESTGQIIDVDFHIFEEVCRYIQMLKGMGISPSISVNISRHTMFTRDFGVRYNEIRKKYGVKFDEITLEFTESISVNDVARFTKIINELRELGFVCSMDDFGSAYSSLNTLSAIELEEIKLDREFLMNNGASEKKKTIIRSVLKMASSLNMETVAEGVESLNEIAELEKDGCDYIQGYAYAKPMSADNFTAWIKNS